MRRMMMENGGITSEKITITQKIENAEQLANYFKAFDNNQDGYTFYIFEGEANVTLTDNKILTLCYYKGQPAYYARRRSEWSAYANFSNSYDTTCDIGDTYIKIDI